MRVHRDTRRSREYDAGKLDQKAIDDIISQTGEGVAVVKLEMTGDLLSWPREIRSAVWRLCEVLEHGLRRKSRLIVKGKEYLHPGHLVSAVLADNLDNPAKMGRALDMVVEAIIACSRAEDYAKESAEVIKYLLRVGKIIAQQ